MSRIKMRKNKHGHFSLRIFQDLNYDGLISKREAIYKGKSKNSYQEDELLDFEGKIHLSKRMHQCEWLTAKHPGESIICTMEYIPVVYTCTLFNNEGV